ncbi:MAG: hypothetical protein IJR49_02885, partial [Treponema sp.]|nr:hypothetical protein [Treponema sp.]
CLIFQVKKIQKISQIILARAEKEKEQFFKIVPFVHGGALFVRRSTDSLESAVSKYRLALTAHSRQGKSGVLQKKRKIFFKII